MANITEVLRRLVSPYYRVILIAVILIIFSLAGYYAYNAFYVKKEKNPFKDVANVNRGNREADVFFFHVDWCPHCKKAIPEWNKFKSEMDGKEINGYKLKCVDMDCTTETSDITRAINEYKIEGYPTIKLLKDGQVIEFDSKITTTSLTSFANTMLND